MHRNRAGLVDHHQRIILVQHLDGPSSDAGSARRSRDCVQRQWRPYPAVTGGSCRWVTFTILSPFRSTKSGDTFSPLTVILPVCSAHSVGSGAH